MQKIYFLDIDDCLIETSSLGADEISAVQNAFEKQKIPFAREITFEFAVQFRRLYDHHQGKKLSSTDEKKRQKFLERLKALEKPIINQYGQIKKWSREIMLFLAAQKFGVHLTEKQLMVISQNLWNAIAHHTPFYPDALPFLRKLKDNKIPCYLISSSDCRLQLNQKSNEFIYNPHYSRDLKMKRLQKFLDLGIPAENIFLGDPYDKPNPWVFEEALKKAQKELTLKGEALQGRETVMVGDSFQNDLIPAKRAGIRTLVWLVRHAKKKKEVRKDKIILINSLSSLFNEQGKI